MNLANGQLNASFNNMSIQNANVPLNAQQMNYLGQTQHLQQANFSNQPQQQQPPTAQFVQQMSMINAHMYSQQQQQQVSNANVPFQYQQAFNVSNNAQTEIKEPANETQLISFDWEQQKTLII